MILDKGIYVCFKEHSFIEKGSEIRVRVDTLERKDTCYCSTDLNGNASFNKSTTLFLSKDLYDNDHLKKLGLMNIRKYKLMKINEKILK